MLTAQWRQSQITGALIQHLQQSKDLTLRTAMVARRDGDKTFQLLEKAHVLDELLVTITTASFVS